MQPKTNYYCAAGPRHRSHLCQRYENRMAHMILYFSEYTAVCVCVCMPCQSHFSRSLSLFLVDPGPICVSNYIDCIKQYNATYTQHTKKITISEGHTVIIMVPRRCRTLHAHDMLFIFNSALISIVIGSQNDHSSSHLHAESSAQSSIPRVSDPEMSPPRPGSALGPPLRYRIRN